MGWAFLACNYEFFVWIAAELEAIFALIGAGGNNRLRLGIRWRVLWLAIARSFLLQMRQALLVGLPSRFTFFSG
jgi:hypothetical protein